MQSSSLDSPSTLNGVEDDAPKGAEAAVTGASSRRYTIAYAKGLIETAHNHISRIAVPTSLLSHKEGVLTRITELEDELDAWRGSELDRAQ